MSYQQVKQPKFYVSILQWLKAINGISWLSNESTQIASTNPYFETSKTHPLSIFDLNSLSKTMDISNFQSTQVRLNYCYLSKMGNLSEMMPTSNNFFMVLNHNMKSWGFYIHPQDNANLSLASSVNAVSYSSRQLTYRGWALGTGNNANSCNNRVGISINVPSTASGVYKFSKVAYGTYYTIDSPDLQINIETTYPKSTSQKSLNFGTFKNTLYAAKNTNWIIGGAWDLDGNSKYKKLSRTGFKKWNLKFSTIMENNLFSSNASLSTKRMDWSDGSLDEDVNLNNTGYFKYNLLTDNSFYSQVWHKTLNGNLPFIFNPSGENNQDDFYLVKFLDNSLKVTRDSHNTYSISFKLIEVQ